MGASNVKKFRAKAFEFARRRPYALAIAAVLAWFGMFIATNAQAQKQVFKCTKQGKLVYQDSKCEEQGREVLLTWTPAKPGEVQAAQDRVDRIIAAPSPSIQPIPRANCMGGCPPPPVTRYYIVPPVVVIRETVER